MLKKAAEAPALTLKLVPIPKQPLKSATVEGISAGTDVAEEGAMEEC